MMTLYGREAVEDLEVRAACGETAVDREIERLGLAFQIATRLTSWVAVSEVPAVDPTQPSRRERMPHALPVGLSAEGLGLRAATMADVVACPATSWALARVAELHQMADRDDALESHGLRGGVDLGRAGRGVRERDAQA